MKDGDNKGQDMKNCKHCNTKIDPLEIYGDWFYCSKCNQDFDYQPERLNPEDHIDDVNGMICDSLNSMET